MSAPKRKLQVQYEHGAPEGAANTARMERIAAGLNKELVTDAEQISYFLSRLLEFYEAVSLFADGREYHHVRKDAPEAQ